MWTSKTIANFWQRSQSSFAGDTNAREIIRLSRRYISGKVLDVGAGSGALLHCLPHATGIDIVPRELHIRQGSIDAIPFEDKTFSTVFCTDVLEHLPDVTLVDGIAEVAQVTRKGGHFILTVPYQENLVESVVPCPACGAEFHRWGHVQVFNRERIETLLTRNGFRVVKIVVLPLGLMAQHFLIRYFWRLFVRSGFIKANDMYVVGERI